MPAVRQYIAGLRSHTARGILQCMHELPRHSESSESSETAAFITDLSALARSPGYGIEAAEAEITAPGTIPLPSYMDPQSLCVDMRGPGGFIDMRALPPAPEQPRPEPAPPILPDYECLRDVRGPDSGLMDMRSWQYHQTVRLRRTEQSPATTETPE
jgi:hypothetical protein